jgi:hypothetical protein
MIGSIQTGRYDWPVIVITADRGERMRRRQYFLKMFWEFFGHCGRPSRIQE